MTDPSRLHFPQTVSQAVRLVTRRFRCLGMDQTGSVLAAGIVILGIFSVLFAAGVRHEGSAQELDIFTAHRRKALDVARGGIEALRVQYDNKYDTVTGTLSLGPDEPVDENCTLATSAGKDPTDPSRVVLMSRAITTAMSTARSFCTERISIFRTIVWWKRVPRQWCLRGALNSVATPP